VGPVVNRLKIGRRRSGVVGTCDCGFRSAECRSLRFAIALQRCHGPRQTSRTCRGAYRERVRPCCRGRECLSRGARPAHVSPWPKPGKTEGEVVLHASVVVPEGSRDRCSGWNVRDALVERQVRRSDCQCDRLGARPRCGLRRYGRHHGCGRGIGRRRARDRR